MVRNAVERDGARVVLIDSLTGYHNAMPGEPGASARPPRSTGTAPRCR
jgi:hypothetical protein